MVLEQTSEPIAVALGAEVRSQTRQTTVAGALRSDRTSLHRSVGRQRWMECPHKKQLALVKCQTGKSKLRPQLRWAIDTPKKQSTDGTGYRWETNYRLHFFAGWDVEMNMPAIKEGLIFCISCSLHNHGNSYIRGSNSQQMGWISMGEYLIECASLPAGMI